MPRVSESTPSLLQGVSQQPSSLRTPDQVEEMENCLVTIDGRVHKRPPSEHVMKLAGLSPADAALSFFHEFTDPDDDDDRLLVITPGGGIRLFNVTAKTEITVDVQTGVTTGAGSYLDSTNPAQDLRAVTVADYTFILNRTVRPLVGAVGDDLLVQDPLYFWLNRVNPDGSESAVGDQFQYEPNFGGAIIGGVQDFSELPETASDGNVYQITGTTQTGFATHYVVRRAGVWEETVYPGLKNTLRADKMPHALVSLAGNAKFGRFSWEPRRVGDDYSNPHPSFVGRSINDIFFFKGRLGFLVDENVVMSEFNNFGGFHRKTVLDLLDTAPLDIAVNEAEASVLRYAVPFQIGLLVFGDDAQYRITGESTLSPDTVSIDLTTRDPTLDVRPHHSGNDVYFPVESGDYAGIVEYFVEKDTFLTRGSPITGHVPRFIPKDLRSFTVAEDQDILITVPQNSNELFIYRWYWQGDQKILASWSKWSMAPGWIIHYARATRSGLLLVVEHGGEIHVELINLRVNVTPEKSPIPLKADSLFLVDSSTATYDSGAGRTTWTLPFDPTTYPNLVVIKTNDHASPGARFDASVVQTTSNSVSVPGNYTGTEVYVGNNYLQKIRLSEQFVRDARAQARRIGRLQLLSMLLGFEDTDSFTIRVYPYGIAYGLQDVIVVTPGRTLTTQGDLAFTLDSPVPVDGSYEFGIMADSKDAAIYFENDQHTDAVFGSVEWEGQYTNRRVRVG